MSRHRPPFVLVFTLIHLRKVRFSIQIRVETRPFYFSRVKQCFRSQEGGKHEQPLTWHFWMAFRRHAVLGPVVFAFIAFLAVLAIPVIIFAFIAKVFVLVFRA